MNKCKLIHVFYPFVTKTSLLLMFCGGFIFFRSKLVVVSSILLIKNILAHSKALLLLYIQGMF